MPSATTRVVHLTDTIYAVCRYDADGNRIDVTFETGPSPDTSVESFTREDYSKAVKKARKLLRRHLTPAQLEDYNAHNAFDVKGGETGRRYRIYPWYGENILRYRSPRAGPCKMCFLPEHRIPEPDMMLMQKLALELREGEALKVSNFWQTNTGGFREMRAYFDIRADESRFIDKERGLW